jgi:molecular chaperone HtpG
MVALGHRMPFETNFGTMDLATFREVSGDKNRIRAVETTQEFGHLAPLATAQGVGVVNASYVHDTNFLRAFAELHGAEVVRMTRDELSVLIQPAPDLMKVYEKVRRAAEPLLAAMDVTVEVGRFEPAAVPAFLLTDATQLRERAKALITGSESPLVKSLLSGLAVARSEAKTRFVLNGNNALVQALPGSSDPAATGHIVRLLYLQSAMMFRRTLSIGESRGFTEDLLALLGKLLVPAPKDVN